VYIVHITRLWIFRKQDISYKISIEGSDFRLSHFRSDVRHMNHRLFHQCGLTFNMYCNGSYLTYIDVTLKNDTSYYLCDLRPLIDKRCAAFFCYTLCDLTSYNPLSIVFLQFYKCKLPGPLCCRDSRLVNTCHCDVILEIIYSLFFKSSYLSCFKGE